MNLAREETRDTCYYWWGWSPDLSRALGDNSGGFVRGDHDLWC